MVIQRIETSGVGIMDSRITGYLFAIRLKFHFKGLHNRKVYRSKKNLPFVKVVDDIAIGIFGMIMDFSTVF